MGKTPAISIIIPCYNAENDIRKGLDSVVNQSFKNIEVVLVNDGSKDSTGDIIKSYARNDDRLVIIEKPNGGVSAARNTGIEKATGKYMMFIDSDDWIDAQTCEVAVEEIEKHNADVVMWSYIREFKNKSLEKIIYDEERVIFEGPDVKNILYRRLVGLIDEELAHPENMDALSPVWAKLYRSEIIKENNIEFTDLSIIGTCEDCLFNLQVFSFAQKAVYINKCFYHYLKTNTDSLTSNHKPKLYTQWQRLFDIILSEIRTNSPTEDAYQALDNRISWSIVGLGLNILQSNKKHTEKIKEIKLIISSERYRKVYKTLTLKPFPFSWKVFFMFAKLNFATGVYLMLIMVSKMIGRE